MDNITEALNLLLAPMGLKARTFLIDYRDNKGLDYNTTVYSAYNCDDDILIVYLRKDFTLRGFTVTGITEILDGYSKEELEKMAMNDPQETAKHMKLLYYNE